MSGVLEFRKSFRVWLGLCKALYVRPTPIKIKALLVTYDCYVFWLVMESILLEFKPKIIYFFKDSF